MISGDGGSGVPEMTWQGKEGGNSPNCSWVVSSSDSWEVLGKGGGSWCLDVGEASARIVAVRRPLR
jgi:hypothetical protein